MQLHTAAFAFMEVSGQAHLGQDDAFHRRHVTDVTSAPRFQWREAGAEGTSPVESVTLSKNPGACLVNANAAVRKRKHLPRTWSRTPIVLIRPPSAPSDPFPGSTPCRGCCSRTPFRLRLLLPCLLLRRRRPGPRRACRASSLRSYPRTRGRSSFGNCAAGTTGSAVRVLGSADA